MSWFNRNTKNRRLGREHVLDVKLRSDQVRASRMRLAAIALGLAFGTIFCFYLVWRSGEWAMNQLVYENKAFSIQDIDVQTDGIIAPAQLRRWAGVKPGENLLALDLARVKRDLEMVSLVRSVAVERVLPHTLRLRVSERDPLARIFVTQVAANGSLQTTVLHMDEEGYVMALLEPQQQAVPTIESNNELPEIVGIAPNLPAPGRRVDSQQARSALQLLVAFEHSPMANVLELRRVDVSSPEVLQVTTSEGSTVTFAVQDLERQLRRWHDIYDLGQKLNKAVASLDLSVPNNIPARMVDASTVPPGNPKVKNQQRNRKRNV